MDVDRLAWRTSTFTGNNGSSCVEVAPVWPAHGGHGPSGVAVRDTKDRTRAPHLHSPAAWSAFVAGIRAGAFER